MTSISSPRVPSVRPGVASLLLGLLLGFGAVVLASALLAPPLFAAVDALTPGSFPFQRILRRLAMLLALLVLIAGLRRAGVRRLTDAGFGTGPGRLKAAVFGAACGAAGITLAFAVELALANRAGSLDELTAPRLAKAFAGASAVALLEEGICRGALLFPFGPMSGAGFVAANGATSALFATGHFLRGVDSPRELDAWSGFRIWGELPAALRDHGEAWTGLFLTGALLYLLAARQGHVWGAVGVHGGAVLALQILGTATEPVAGRDALFLVDGLLPGWGTSLLIALAIAALSWRGAESRAAADRRYK